MLLAGLAVDVLNGIRTQAGDSNCEVAKCLHSVCGTSGMWAEHKEGVCTVSGAAACVGVLECGDAVSQLHVTARVKHAELQRGAVRLA
jgi:hypothetical protein